MSRSMRASRWSRRCAACSPPRLRFTRTPPRRAVRGPALHSMIVRCTSKPHSSEAHMPPKTKLDYHMRLYRTLRAANRRYSTVSDMAAHPFPALIQLQTINACNASCIMCPYPLFKKQFPRGRMDDALFDKIIEEIAERPEVHTFVPMLQNEPFLDKKLFDRIARFKQLTRGGVEVELVTSGAFLTAEAIERMREVELDVLDISLDAVSKA